MEDIMEFLERRVTGYKKLERGLPCEDAVYIKELSDCIIMACADGHGDSRCTYAARGAELAVRIIVSELERIRAESDDTEDFGERLNESRRQLKENIVCSWVGAVLDDYRVTHAENEAFKEKYKELYAYSKKIFEVRDGSLPVRELRELFEYRHNCEEAIRRITFLYGTTVNAAVVSGKFVFSIGIGDGDVVAVNGKRVEWLLPPSERLGTTTDSLSSSFDTIIDRFNAVLVPVKPAKRITDNRFLPELVMIATDGLRNAFLGDEEFVEKLLDISALLKKGNGYSFTRYSKQWLEERTKFGVTQDDISFCICTKHNLKRKNKKNT